jgi:hypothetical protein
VFYWSFILMFIILNFVFNSVILLHFKVRLTENGKILSKYGKGKVYKETAGRRAEYLHCHTEDIKH